MGDRVGRVETKAATINNCMCYLMRAAAKNKPMNSVDKFAGAASLCDVHTRFGAPRPIYGVHHPRSGLSNSRQTRNRGG